MSNSDTAKVPTLEEVRRAFSSIITRIVEYYQLGPHRYAAVEEIVEGIGLENAAERETVYSAIDPYSEFAQKRDPAKPLLFRRVAPGEYQFLGFSGDPLDLTQNTHINDPLLREAYDVFFQAITKSGAGAQLKALPFSKRVASFHRNLMRSPHILAKAQDRLESKRMLESIDLKLPE